MRVMVIIKANEDSEAGMMPSEKVLTEMGKFNEELVKAGIMLDGEGLHPTSKAKRVKFSAGNRIVTDGPFAETRELIAGYWIWKVNSMDEAVEWVKRIPFDANGNERRRESRFDRSSKRKTSATSTLPNCENRKNAFAHKPQS